MGMEALDKLQLLSEASKWEAGEKGCRDKTIRTFNGIILTRAALPDGRSTTLLKSLLNSACENNCLYCPMRAGRDFHRTAFQPEEFARLVVNLTTAGLIQGVFLSSGIAGGSIHTQDQLIDTAQILRLKLQYRGYLHLKIMPGAEYDQIAACMCLADRVSINLEAPNEQRLTTLAPQKEFYKQLLRPIEIIAAIRKNLSPQQTNQGKWPSSCTQFVLGGAAETDRELLQTTQVLHRQYQISRAYFSAFKPHPGTPMAHHAPVAYQREHRLYQADFLIRDYGFNQEELIFDELGNLTQTKDPKWAWADRHLREHPVDLNHASREELLRVPGIGPKSVQLILQIRHSQRIHDLSRLQKIGVHIKRSQDFVVVDGRKPAQQMHLF